MKPLQPASNVSHSAETSTISMHVRNHPGVMLHVCSLLTRKNFRTEEFSFRPEWGGSTARIRFTTSESSRLEQMVQQLKKLQDALEVTLQPRE